MKKGKLKKNGSQTVTEMISIHPRPKKVAQMNGWNLKAIAQMNIKHSLAVAYTHEMPERNTLSRTAPNVEW